MKNSYVPIHCGRKVYKMLEQDIRKVYFMKKRIVPVIPKENHIPKRPNKEVQRKQQIKDYENVTQQIQS